MANKVALSNAKKAPFTLPSANPSLAHERVVLDCFETCHNRLKSWRAIFGLQKPQYRSKITLDTYAGSLTLSRGPSKTLPFTQRESAPYVLSAHQSFLLVQERAAARDAFLALEQALLGVPALRSRVLALKVTGNYWDWPANNPVGERITYGMFKTITCSARPREALTASLALLRGIAVQPDDPVWQVGKTRIQACDAQTALFVHHALTTPTKDSKVSSGDGMPVVRIDHNLALHHAVNARFNARRAALAKG